MISNSLLANTHALFFISLAPFPFKSVTSIRLLSNKIKLCAIVLSDLTAILLRVRPSTLLLWSGRLPDRPFFLPLGEKEPAAQVVV